MTRKHLNQMLDPGRSNTAAQSAPRISASILIGLREPVVHDASAAILPAVCSLGWSRAARAARAVGWLTQAEHKAPR